MTAHAPDSVFISPAVLDALISHASDDDPDECCGLLVGSLSELNPSGGHGLSIDEAVRMTNVERGPTRYRIDPVEHLRLQERLRGTGRIIAGANHSHTRAAAVPSPSDLREAFYPDFVYVIVSLANRKDPEVRAWRMVGAEASEVELIPAG